MYAIVQVGGRQYRAAPGERLVVDRLPVEPGSRVHLSDVRMLIAEEGDGTETEIGRPRVADVAVAARAISHFRGPKILVFKYKPKKRYRRHQGFRAELTELRVEEVRRGAYEDKPAPAAKKRPPARAAGSGATGVVPPGLAPESTPKVSPKAKPATGTARARATGAPKSAARPRVSSGAAGEGEKPKANRAARRPAEKGAAAPKERKPTRPRTKSADKQEPSNGT
ncbi:MAG TPA: 50S ribosomal protein L21 [Candidatus Micrarchaeaceae archaeon]|nr:50S ribosomal protein L21 [Candidatus Micrarchaeaceae archaeon]